MVPANSPATSRRLLLIDPVRAGSRAGSGTDTEVMRYWPDRDQWVHTFMGIIDSAFELTDEEQLVTADTLRSLFSALRIPDRGSPREVPMPLLLEITSRFYTTYLRNTAKETDRPQPRAAGPGELLAPIEAWRSALANIIFLAYPDLSPEERLATDKILTDLLGALGVSRRRANFLPVDIQQLIS